MTNEKPESSKGKTSGSPVATNEPSSLILTRFQPGERGTLCFSNRFNGFGFQQELSRWNGWRNFCSSNHPVETG